MNSLFYIIPPILVIVLALVTKNVIIALFVGVVTGSILINGVGFIPPIIDKYMVNGMAGNANLLICTMVLGIMLQFIKRSGGYKAFGEWTNRNIKSAKQTMHTVFWLSMAMALAEYLANLCIPRVMKPSAIQNKVPVEKLPMIVISVMSPLNSLLPCTIFILFFSGLIVSAVEGVDGMAVFIQAIPFQFFAISSVIFAFLYSYGIIPDIGPIKKINDALQKSGSNTENVESVEDLMKNDPEMYEIMGGDVEPDIWGLILPLGTMIISIPIFSLIMKQIVVTAGTLMGAIVAVVYALITKKVKFNELFDGFASGIKDMADILLILTFAFSFGQVVNELGFAEFVVNLLGQNFSAKLIPLVFFLACCILSYTTGSLSAASVIVFPLALPLAMATGSHIALTVGACISGCHFGDLFSPISDNVLMPSGAAGINPVNIAKVLTPYRLAQLALCSLLYVGFGMILC